MSTDKREVNVLSIDAWADGEDGWTWNQWFNIGKVDVDAIPDTESAIIQLFIDEGYAKPLAAQGCYIDDDGYNLVLTSKKNHEPLFAIAYGEVES